MITIIIVIVAITAGTIGWLFAKRTQTPIMQNQAKEENLPLTQQDKSLKYDIHFPDRYSGTGCYKKEADGTENQYEFREDFNIDAPTTTVKYSNTEKGISFDIPFNPNWGNEDCKVKPYIEFTHSSGDISIEFSKPTAPVGREFGLIISKYRPAEDIITAEQKDVYPNPNPRKKTIGDKNMIVYDDYGMIQVTHYEVIGKKYNYIFSYSNYDSSLNDSLIKSLESIIADMEIKNVE
ncbi:MAG: hypothetical protein IPN70_02935 [Candidatus Moraniibacteriota bacterium]|nr:MAG: hypothetical protein IPN70_02935 [Candidatus Moranbacteria bacterium]